MWRTFPPPPTGETGTPHVFLVTRWSCRPRNSHVFLFREMALSAPERRRRLSCDNDIRCISTMTVDPADVPTPYGRSSDGPRSSSPRCLSCSHPSLLIDGSVYILRAVTRSALPPAPVCLCLCPSLYPITVTPITDWNWRRLFLSAAVAPD